MLAPEALATTDKIFQAVFGQDNPFTLEKLKEKFAFDIQLPTEVKDSATGETTYTAAPNAKKFMIDKNTWDHEWERPYRPLSSMNDILAAWDDINDMSTERVYHSENVHASDPIYDSVNIYGSTNCGRGKNLLYCDDSYDCSFCLACSRSGTLNFCIRTDDSSNCSNSYGVICSNKITNSLFIQDANTLHECMFCSHIEQKEYCIANMQFEKDEYLFLKSQVIKWLLES